jgi:hypothetical protein
MAAAMDPAEHVGSDPASVDPRGDLEPAEQGGTDPARLILVQLHDELVYPGDLQ